MRAEIECFAQLAHRLNLLYPKEGFVRAAELVLRFRTSEAISRFCRLPGDDLMDLARSARRNRLRGELLARRLDRDFGEEDLAGMGKGQEPFFKMPYRFFDEWAGQLKPSIWQVYEYLYRRRNSKDGEAWPSEDRIAEDLGLSRSTVVRALGELEKECLITIMPRPKKGGGSRNFYEVVTPETWLKDNDEVEQFMRERHLDR